METDLESAYQRYFPLIREKCRRVLRDAEEAQDVAQETFIRLWKAGLSTDDPRQVTAWIYRTSTNLAVDRLRSRRIAPAAAGASAELDVLDERSTEGTFQLRQDLEAYARRLPVDEDEGGPSARRAANRRDSGPGRPAVRALSLCSCRRLRSERAGQHELS